MSAGGALAALLGRVPPVFVGYHAVRFVGVAFLVLAAQGALAPEWAVPAGWGDIAVAVLALGVVAFACPPLGQAQGKPLTRGQWGAVLTWNVFGLLDILFVLGSGARIVRADPTALEPLTRLPSRCCRRSSCRSSSLRTS